MKKFELKEDFINSYKGKQPKWGYNGFGYVVYKRTYARQLQDGSTEEFWQTIKRVVEGVFNIQKDHCEQYQLPWDNRRANKSAQRMYELMWEFKFSPPGRGLWMMGAEYIKSRGGAALNNCAFTTTENLDLDFAEPFCFLMDMSMVGVGVGSDTKGAGKIKIKEPKTNGIFTVEDTREGWVELLRTILNAYVGITEMPCDIDYTLVRPAGTPIKGFGGVASGSEPLKEMIKSVFRQV